MNYWVCERGGTPAGPYELDRIRALASAGHISTAALVCRVGDTAWVGLSDLANGGGGHEVSVPGMRIPMAAPSGRRLVLRDDLGTPSVIALSIVTFGIYGLVWFYKTAMAYRELAGSSRPTPALFWWYVALCVLSAIAGVFLLPVLAIAGVVVGAVLLRQVLSDREAAIRVLDIRPDVYGAGSHMWLWILGSVLIWVIIGLIPALIQAIWFVSDHRKFVAAAYRVRPDLAGGSV